MCTIIHVLCVSSPLLKFIDTCESIRELAVGKYKCEFIGFSAAELKDFFSQYVSYYLNYDYWQLH